MLLRGLALGEIGWGEEAVESFTAVLDAPEVSPYYPLALLGMAEEYHRGEQRDAAAEALRRYFEEPWRGTDRRARRIQTLLETYGDLRRTPWVATFAESELVRDRALLAEHMARRRERPSERLLYLFGFDLFRGGRCEQSLDALGTIGLVSFYEPYALYTAAQCRYALGRLDEAQAAVRALLDLPAIGREEQALAERAGLLQAQLQLEAGEAEAALTRVGSLGGDGAFALEARLFRAELLLERGETSLALAYLRDLAAAPLEPHLEAERALSAGRAYEKLGDTAAAADSVAAAAAVIGKERSALEADAGRGEAGRLEKRLADRLAAEQRSAAARRARIATGLERNERFKGPLNLGKIARVLSVSHRHTVIGEPVVDLERLAVDDRGVAAETLSPRLLGPLGLEYLRSPARRRIDALIAARLALDSASEPADEATARGLVACLDGEGAADDERAEGYRALGDLLGESVVEGAPTPRELRRRVLSATARPVAPRADAAAAAGDVARRLLEAATRRALGAIVEARAKELRRIDFDLQAELSRLMAVQTGVAHAPAAQPPPAR